MSNNLIPNGDFSSGNFKHWIPKAYDTPMAVELWESNYVARMVGGRSSGQNLASETFSIAPGLFKFSFDVRAPDSMPLEDTADRRFHIQDHDKVANSPLLHAFLSYIVWARHSDGSESNAWTGTVYVDAQKKQITVEGELPEGFTRADVHFGFPSDPFGNKGPYFLDNVQFVMQG
ncbi:hypothetical protein PS718_02904 [Pseudomonas fluorescens]|uniref:Uncharacterized protein n=1 Tax=Pseudomonas fluorescens TaxID=294 RepID=A0A5E7D810_PSEFL|nr:hypothetical protein [Pseudomonas fluorescens]VVO04124.1 hypothetical protein PS718_02904 [Pseudomonas fluorescens]